MSDTLISALIQAPFVLATIYLVHRFLTHLNARDQEWRAFTEHTHEALGMRLDGLTEAIDRLTHMMYAHNAGSRGGVDAPPRPQAEDPLFGSEPIPFVRRSR